MGAKLFEEPTTSFVWLNRFILLLLAFLLFLYAVDEIYKLWIVTWLQVLSYSILSGSIIARLLLDVTNRKK